MSGCEGLHCGGCGKGGKIAAAALLAIIAVALVTWILTVIWIIAAIVGVIFAALGIGIFLYVRGRPQREANFAAALEQRRLAYAKAQAISAPRRREIPNQTLIIQVGDRPIEEIQQLLRGRS